jgi:fatty acid desaturase
VQLNVFWLSVLALVHFTNTWFFFLIGYVIPLFVFLPIFALISEASEHTGTDKILDTDSAETAKYIQDVRSSRTRIYNRFLDWLLHSHNDGYHVEHHFMASIPSHFLPIVHEELKKEGIDLIQSESLDETLRQMSSGINV